MNDPGKRREPLRGGSTAQGRAAGDTAILDHPPRQMQVQYRVEIVAPDGRVRLWDVYDIRPIAESIAATLRGHGMFA